MENTASHYVISRGKCNNIRTRTKETAAITSGSLRTHVSRLHCDKDRFRWSWRKDKTSWSWGELPSTSLLFVLFISVPLVLVNKSISSSKVNRVFSSRRRVEGCSLCSHTVSSPCARCRPKHRYRVAAPGPHRHRGISPWPPPDYLSSLPHVPCFR